MSWKEAASLIIMALKEKPYTSLYNYQLLMLKRSDKSSFMPNGYVFPGGTAEAADSSPNWLNILNKFSITPSKTVTSVQNLPPIFHSNNSGLPKELSLRITAIRETFEETGVLLCRKAPSQDNRWASTITGDLSQWRSRVQTDPAQFISMCDALNCVPDLYAIKLWSNWLTPPDFPKRFDTVFYIAHLPGKPESSADLTEVQKLEWCSPENLRRDSLQGKLWLPPPQFYELNRIMLFHMVEDLSNYAGEREVHGCERYGSEERMKTKEGLIFPMPGDDVYGVVDSGQYTQTTFEAARSSCRRLHRLEIRKDGRCEIVVSGLEPTQQHVLPLSALRKCCSL